MNESACLFLLKQLCFSKIKTFVFTKPPESYKVIGAMGVPATLANVCAGDGRDAGRSACGEEGQGHPYPQAPEKRICCEEAAGQLCLLPARVVSPHAS